MSRYKNFCEKLESFQLKMLATSQNRCVEVKSIFTLFADEEIVYKKKTAAEASGLQYDIYVYDGKKQMMVL